MSDEVKCPKCGYESGDTWAQCGGSCPMPMSPHYVADEMLSQLQTKYCCAAWNEGCNCGEIADRIIAQAAEIKRLRKEVKSEQKQTDNAMDNYDAMQRRCEAQAAEIEKLREALKRIQHFSPAYMWRASDIQEITSAALGETK